MLSILMRLLIFIPLLVYLCWALPRLLPAKKARWVWPFRGLILLSFLGVIVGMVHYRTQQPDPQGFWNWISAVVLFSLVGTWISIAAIRLPFDLAVAAVAGIRKGISRFPSFLRWEKRWDRVWDPTRRFFARDAVGAAVLAVGPVSTFLGSIQASQGPKVKEIQVPIQNLPDAWSNLKIVQISDLHVGLTILKNYTQDVVEKVLAQKPDLIVLTGDLMDGSVAQLRDHIEPLARLALPQASRYGAYFVTGNHEYYSGHLEWIAQFRAMGFQYLENSNRIVTHSKLRDRNFLIGGVPDPAAKQMDPDATVDVALAAQVDRAVDFKILLAHRPSACDEAAQAGFDLQLSGHTHAGQFIPWSFYVPLAHPYSRGLNRHQNRLWVYVSPGTGYWGPPNRFGISSEVSVLRLVRSER